MASFSLRVQNTGKLKFATPGETGCHLADAVIDYGDGKEFDLHKWPFSLILTHAKKIMTMTMIKIKIMKKHTHL